VYTAASETDKWISLNGWKDESDGYVCVTNQEDNIKTKNITEKITFDGKSACEFLILGVFRILNDSEYD